MSGNDLWLELRNTNFGVEDCFLKLDSMEQLTLTSHSLAYFETKVEYISTFIVYSNLKLDVDRREEEKFYVM